MRDYPAPTYYFKGVVNYGCNHFIVWRPSSTSGNHPKDMEEYCIKCGAITANVTWNGVYHTREGNDERL